MINKKQIEHIVRDALDLGACKHTEIDITSGKPVYAVEYVITNKKVKTLVEKINLKIRSEVMEALEEYNRFLIDNQYVDVDVETEEPTAIQEFMASKTEKV